MRIRSLDEWRWELKSRIGLISRQISLFYTGIQFPPGLIDSLSFIAKTKMIGYDLSPRKLHQVTKLFLFHINSTTGSFLQFLPISVRDGEPPSTNIEISARRWLPYPTDNTSMDNRVYYYILPTP